jgi:hypothetical protein
MPHPSHRTAPRSLVVAAAIALAPLGLAACGGSSSEKAAEPTVVAPPDSTVPGARPGPPEGTKHYAGLKRDHTEEPVAYAQNPPVGGAHHPQWQACGFSPEPVEPGRGVHSMEHGAVWVTYSPDLPADQVEVLESLVAGRTHLLVSPYEGLPSPVVASAWGEQLLLDSAQDPRLVEFVNYYEQGPQTPEPGVPC